MAGSCIRSGPVRLAGVRDLEARVAAVTAREEQPESRGLLKAQVLKHYEAIAGSETAQRSPAEVAEAIGIGWCELCGIELASGKPGDYVRAGRVAVHRHCAEARAKSMRESANEWERIANENA